MIRQLAGLAAKGIVNNQGKTVFDTKFNSSGNTNIGTNTNTNKDDKKQNKEDKIKNKKSLKITPTTNWQDLKNKIIKNRNVITLNLGKPSNNITEVLVDINSFNGGEKTKTFNVSIAPEFDRSFSIIKAINPKNSKQQDLIVPKNEQKANKNLKYAQIGYNTFYEDVIV